MNKEFNIDGHLFGKLIVRGEPIRKQGRIYYHCVCKCGKEITARRDHLLSGATTSCGHCESIVDEGDYLRYVCKNGHSFLFDVADLDTVLQHCWYISSTGYVCTRLQGSRRVVELSRMLLGASTDLFIDHIDSDTLNNRRENLRLATKAENTYNLSLRSNNTSGYKGVSYITSAGKFCASITRNNITTRLGYFVEPEEAARAYDRAARFLFGEFSCLNFPLTGEQGCRRLAT